MENENNKLDRKRLSEIVPALTTVISDPDDQFSLFDWGHGEIIGLIHHYEDDPDTEVEDVLSGGVKGGLGYCMTRLTRPTSKWTARIRP